MINIRIPVSGEGFVTKICKSIVEFCEYWLVKNALRPIFFLMPPMLVTNVVMKQELKQQVAVILGDPIGSFINNSGALILIGAYLYVVIIKAIYSGIVHYSKPDKELTRDDILAILASIDTVVGDKSRRITAYVKSKRSPPYRYGQGRQR